MIRHGTLATSSSSPELCTHMCQLYSVVPTRDLHYTMKRVAQAQPHASHFLGRMILPAFYSGFEEVPRYWRLIGERRRKPGRRYSDPESALVARRLKCVILRAELIYVLTLHMGPRTASMSLASFMAASAAWLRVPAARSTLSRCQFRASKCYFFSFDSWVPVGKILIRMAWVENAVRDQPNLPQQWMWVVDDSLWRGSLSRFLLKNTVEKVVVVVVYFIYSGNQNRQNA